MKNLRLKCKVYTFSITSIFLRHHTYLWLAECIIYVDPLPILLGAVVEIVFLVGKAKLLPEAGLRLLILVGGVKSRIKNY